MPITQLLSTGVGRLGGKVISIDFVALEVEDPDLSISFAVEGTLGSENIFLTRTPEFEPLLDPEDRGVRLSPAIDDDGEILVEVKIARRLVTLSSSNREYVLDLSGIPDEDFCEMINVLESMNFDSSFKCHVA